MQELFILGSSSFLLALVLTPVFRRVFQRHGVLDRPDETRKLHTRPIPAMGGVPIAIAYLASFGVLLLFGWRQAIHLLDFSMAAKMVPAVAIVFIAGLLDDRYNLQPVQKLLAQIIGGAAAFMAGVRVTGLVGHPLPFSLSVLVTIFWLVACTNAFNLIDGIDGLAAGVGLFATVTTLIAALIQHNLALAAATAPLAGALLGFLRYNFNPASIFLGDSGSLLIGFLLGCFGAIWSQKSTTLLGMTAPLMALSIPILDILLSVVRRFLRRQPIFRGDRGHIHHRLLALGFSQRVAVLILYGMCAFGAVFSILQSISANRYNGAVILVFCIVAWIGLQHLGYVEFDQARRMIVRRGFREALNSELTLRAFEQSFIAATTVDERWSVLKETCKSLGFWEVRWRLSGIEYHEALWGIDGDAAWTLHVPLNRESSIDLSRASDASPLGINITVLADLLRRTLGKQDVGEEVLYTHVDIEDDFGTLRQAGF